MENVPSAEKLANFLVCADELEAAVAGLSESDLDLNKGEGWSIREIVHHIADGDDIWMTGIKQALGNPESEFHLGWYWELTQDEWAGHWAYRNRELRSSLALFRARRSQIADLLSHRPEAWGACLRIHWPEQEKEERIPVAAILDNQNNHAYGHLADILTIRKMHRR